MDSSNWFGGEAELVWQGRDVHGDVHFHAPRRPAGGRSQVPPVPAHYTNYERPLRELDEWFGPSGGDADGDGPRVAVLRGPPGSGKTTLANRWVQRHRADYADGHFFVRLTGSSEEAEQERPALERLLLDVGFAPDEIPASLEGRSARWRSWSEGRRIALVVDDALTAGQVRALLPGAGPSAVLVTEAGPLASLRAWVTVRSVDLTPMADEAARELLGRLVGHERLAAEPEAVDELLRGCEGSTVALCVVGSLLADVPDRPIARLARRLADESRTLKELSRDADLSVTVVLDAAYGRLQPLAQRFYQVMGLHPGSGDVSADAVAVALGIERDDAVDTLDRLARAWLVQEVDEGRYRISGLTRRHAQAKAAAGAEAEAVDDVRRGLVAYYWARALAAEGLTMPGRGWRQQIWPDLQPAVDGNLTAEEAWAWLDAERENLRAAVELAYELGETERTAQLCVALWPLHDQRKHPHDLVATNRLGVAAAVADGNELAAVLLGHQLGYGYRQLGDLAAAAEAFAASLERAERIGSAPAAASSLEALGLARLDQGRQEEAADLLRRNLEIAVELGIPRRLALARFHLAKAEPPERALDLLDQARTTFAALGGEGYNLVKVDLWQGRALVRLGRLDEAGDVLTQAAAAADTGKWHVERAQLCEALADLAEARGEPDAARSHLHDALAIYRHHYLTTPALAVEHRLRTPG